MAEKVSIPASDPNIDSVLHEQRKFECSGARSAQQAHIKSLEEYERMYRESIEEPEEFWAEIAEELHWFKPWDKVLEWNAPWAKWFVGGKINLSYNCLDRHVQTWRKNKAAIIWEGEPGEVRTLTYQQLHQRGLQVCQRAEVARRQEGRSRRHLHGHDARAADRDAGLRAHRRACTPSSSADSAAQRIWSIASTTRKPSPSSRRTAAYRRGGEVKLKASVDEALERCPR